VPQSPSEQDAWHEAMQPSSAVRRRALTGDTRCSYALARARTHECWCNWERSLKDNHTHTHSLCRRVKTMCAGLWVRHAKSKSGV
jgi:hypothetical protein